MLFEGVSYSRETKKRFYLENFIRPVELTDKIIDTCCFLISFPILVEDSYLWSPKSDNRFQVVYH